MAIKANTGLVPYWYTPEQEESDRMTRFKIKPLTGLEHLEIAEELSRKKLAAAQKLAIRYSLIDWENLDDAKGQPVPFSLENMGILGANLLSELAQEALTLSQMDEEQIKN